MFRFRVLDWAQISQHFGSDHRARRVATRIQAVEKGTMDIAAMGAIHGERVSLTALELKAAVAAVAAGLSPGERRRALSVARARAPARFVVTSCGGGHRLARARRARRDAVCPRGILPPATRRT